MHDGWRIFPDADEEQCDVPLYDAARFDSGLQMVSYRVNAFGAQLVHTRRIMCSGFITRRIMCFFEFFSQLPGFIGPKIPNKIEFSDKMPGPFPDISKEQGTDGSSKASAKRIRKEDDI